MILTSGTTLGINLFAHAFGARLAEGDEIVLSELEHHSNIVPWQLLRERTGAAIRCCRSPTRADSTSTGSRRS